MALSLAALSTPAFVPASPVSLSRPAVQSTHVQMNARREALAQGAAALFAGAAVLPASAKAGQFGKQEVFGFAASSPYVTEGLAGGGKDEGTFGYKTVGTKLATGYEKDVTREKAIFDKSVSDIAALKSKIDSKTWWFVRDNLRVQAYEMRSSMLAMNKVSPDPAAAKKAYKKVWTEIESLDLACVKKELDLANKEFADVLAAIDAYKKTV